MQTDYAEAFVTAMLSWMRYIASSVSKMFRGGNGVSGGNGFLRWFRGNWLGILIFLLVAGVVIDFVVWIIRWRPYWLWFHKKRVLLDNDIDLELNEEQLRKKYASAHVHVPKQEMVFPDSEDDSDICAVPMKKRKRRPYEVPEDSLDFFEEDEK